MKYEKFILPREVTIGERTFAVSKIPAFPTAQQVYSAVGKSVSDNGPLGFSMLPSATIKTILEYTALHSDGSWIPLDTEAIANEVFRDSFGDMQSLVLEMIKENFGFFVSGRLLDELEGLEPKAETESGS